MKLIKAIITVHMNQSQSNPGRGESREVQTENPLRLIERHFPDQKSQNQWRKRANVLFET